MVAKLAFKKIKALQGTVAEQRQALEAKAASVSELERTISGFEQTIAGLNEAVRMRDAAVQEAEAKVVQVGAAARLLDWLPVWIHA